MCGIAGIAVSEPEPLGRAALAMAQLLRHRGPDDEGYALFDRSLQVRRHGGADSVLPADAGDIRGADGPVRVALAHRRLAIIDPSPAGHQPMPSARGDRWMAFNGEIYNYRELRDELRTAGHHFRSGSDTEVVLAAWDEWGPGCLTRMVGMWAFAIVDTTRRELVVARDPFGIKPLYTAVAGGRIAFASEHAALLSLPWVDRSEDPAAVYEYLVLGRTDAAEHTFHRGIRQLPAGSWARVELDRIAPLEPVRYWRPRPGMLPGAESMSFAEAAAAVRDRFMESVSLHLRSDVPVGACLSGGIDSSAIVCAMREIGGPQTEIHTFSYVPDDPRVSEERWIDLVARHVGAIRHTTRPDGASLTQQLDDLIAHQGEPFGSTSIYAQYEVFALAGAAGVKVLLDGQGADELLAGYVGYRITMIRDRWNNGQRLDALRRAAAMRHTSTTATSDLHFLRQTLGGRARRVTQRGRALAARVGVRPPVPTVRPLVDPAWTQAHVVPQLSAATDLHSQLVHSLDTTSLPALLRYEDRNSMRFSVESRVPFLTVPLAELVLSLSPDHIVDRQGRTKAVFREAMRGIVPDAILDRTDKIGFTPTERAWLSGAGLLPLPSTLRESAAPVDPDALEERMAAFFASSANLDWELWRAYNLLRWRTTPSRS